MMKKLIFLILVFCGGLASAADTEPGGNKLQNNASAKTGKIAAKGEDKDTFNYLYALAQICPMTTAERQDWLYKLKSAFLDIVKTGIIAEESMTVEQRKWLAEFESNFPEKSDVAPHLLKLNKMSPGNLAVACSTFEEEAALQIEIIHMLGEISKGINESNAFSTKK